MSRLNIIVTGGAGFIGTNLLRKLRQYYSDACIKSLDIRQPAYPVDGVSYEIVDVRDKSTLENAITKADKLFHLAALIGTHESIEDPNASFETNVRGTINVLECARRYKTEVFVAGMPGLWNNPYSISKNASVRMAETYFETYGVKVTVLLWYSVYGPYQYLSRYNKAVPTFINQALRNESLPIYGDGQQVADFIYSDDATSYAIAMIEKKQWGKVIQCASGEGVSVNQLAKTIIELSGSTSLIKYLPMRQGEPAKAHVVANITDLTSLFPNYKQLSLSEGLRRTINYYRSYPPID